MTHRATVLFVCVHNAGRSQIAAALLNHYGMGRIDVRSAGSTPGDRINPTAALVLEEWGLGLVDAQPKLLDPGVVEHSDIVITMGCGDTCPIFPGVKYEDWVIDDPAGQPVELVRQIRDEIDRRVRKLISQLLD
ncbi:MAG: arsenate reductase ArsC [Acidimicrobiales bacterium]|nr:arsenate reductase ArsC [Acidimicrobiales bacterium]